MTQTDRSLVVGLTGPNAAGKGEAAKFLQELGFEYYSLSDVVREEATVRGLDHSRENLIRTGNDLRAAHGPGVLAQRVVETILEIGDFQAIVDSIRSPGEVAVLRGLPGFTLIGVDAPIAVRFERSRARGRLGDGATLEEFVRKESLENTTDPAAQQLTATFKLADQVVDNSGTLAELRAHVAAALGLAKDGQE